jgi:hypothetical protein
MYRVDGSPDLSEEVLDHPVGVVRPTGPAAVGWRRIPAWGRRRSTMPS